MKHTQLLPHERVRVLPPQDGEAGGIEVVCARSMIYFELDALREVTLLREVRVDKRMERALGFCGADALLGVEQMVIVPESHPDFAAALAALGRYAAISEREYRPQHCDQNGHHDE